MARDAAQNPIEKPDIRKQSYLVSQQNNLLAKREESIYGRSEAHSGNITIIAPKSP